MPSRRSAIQMDEHELTAFLAEPGHTMSVATLFPSGEVHLTALWYGFTAEGELGFTTYATSQKALNLGRDPRITVLVEAGSSYSELRGVQIIGRGELSSSDAVKRELSKSIGYRYPMKSKARGGGLPCRVAVMIHPMKVSSWDHSKLTVAGEEAEVQRTQL